MVGCLETKFLLALLTALGQGVLGLNDTSGACIAVSMLHKMRQLYWKHRQLQKRQAHHDLVSNKTSLNREKGRSNGQSGASFHRAFIPKCCQISS